MSSPYTYLTVTELAEAPKAPSRHIMTTRSRARFMKRFGEKGVPGSEWTNDRIKAWAPVVTIHTIKLIVKKDALKKKRRDLPKAGFRSTWGGRLRIRIPHSFYHHRVGIFKIPCKIQYFPPNA